MGLGLGPGLRGFFSLHERRSVSGQHANEASGIDHSPSRRIAGSTENSLSALRRAIELKADYAEIDVHITADGVPIVVHDEDFQRLAGDARRPGEMTLEQVRGIDIGSRFDHAFAGERVATLGEAIDTVRDKIKLNIELKPTKTDRDQLARAVAKLIRDKQFENDCFVTSLDRQAVEICASPEFEAAHGSDCLGGGRRCDSVRRSGAEHSHGSDYRRVARAARAGRDARCTRGRLTIRR